MSISFKLHIATARGCPTSKNPNSYGVSGGPMISARTCRTSMSLHATAIAKHKSDGQISNGFHDDKFLKTYTDQILFEALRVPISTK